MFIEKLSTEIITVEEEIKVVGLSLEKFGFPKKAEKLGEMWGVYESGYRKEIAENNVVNYGFWFNKSDNDYDYLVGSAVAEDAVAVISADGLVASAIPAGRYIKVSFNAKDFGELVCGDGIGKGFKTAKDYADENNLKIKSMPAGIEVYPHALMCVGKENGPEWGLALDEKFITPPETEYPEMYILMAVE